jgi:NAD(P)-dependent dehydrogenase (short-subunit alcohol dehydrogenase family)
MSGQLSGQLAGRVALITGGGAGIGEGMVRRFAAEGAKVVVAEVDEKQGASVAASVDGLFVKCDVARRMDVEGAVEAAVSTYGSIDIVVNNAWGGGSIGRVEDKTGEALSAGMAVAYYGPFWAMRSAFGHMKERGWGRIINMVSLNGVNAHIGSLEYNAAKEALRALTRTAAREWAPTGVTVNAIAPAAKSQAFLRAIGEYPELVALADAANPMGRMGDPYDDIAPVAVFLASEGSRYLTGNTLFVDGGSHINGVAWAPDLDADPHPDRKR